MTKPHTKTEIVVGAFMMLGILALAYLSVNIGGLELMPSARYRLRARFASVGELKEGAPVRIAGVKIGTVTSIRLEDYAAVSELAIGESVELPKDTVASIRTEGLLGNTYVALAPGGSLETLRPGDLVARTEPAIDLLDLVSRYAFTSKDDARPSDAPGSDAPGSDDVFDDPLH